MPRTGRFRPLRPHAGHARRQARASRAAGRAGRFSTELFERYQRSERALVATLAEMYVQGVSTRKVKAITDGLCGHAFWASSISAINKRLAENLAAFADRPLQEPFPYLILDALDNWQAPKSDCEQSSWVGKEVSPSRSTGIAR